MRCKATLLPGERVRRVCQRRRSRVRDGAHTGEPASGRAICRRARHLPRQQTPGSGTNVRGGQVATVGWDPASHQQHRRTHGQHGRAHHGTNDSPAPNSNGLPAVLRPAGKCQHRDRAAGRAPPHANAVEVTGTTSGNVLPRGGAGHCTGYERSPTRR